MEPLDVTAYVLHSVFAGLWTGTVLFVTVAVLPLAREGSLNAAPLSRVTARLRTVTRASSVLLLLTGLYLGLARSYTAESLTGSTGGYLVVAMVVLWVVLAAAVEVGAGKLSDGTDQNKVREPARAARPFLLAGSLFGVLLLGVSGLIAAHNVGAL